MKQVDADVAHVDDLEDRQYHICQCIPLLSAGYFICFMFLLEGLFVVFEICGVLGNADMEFLKRLQEHNPFRNALHSCLWFLGIGDIIASFLGPFGLWLGSNYMPYSWRKLWSMHASIAKGCVGSVLVWRLLVLFMVAPWAGTSFAFEPPHQDKAASMLLTALYVAISLYSVWVLLLSYNMVASETSIMQQKLNSLGLRMPTWAEIFLQEIDYYAEFMPGSQSELSHPTVLCCLSLEAATALYILAVFLGSICWFVQLMLYDETIGGWAFAVSVPHVSETYGLEIALYTLTIIFSVVALAGIVLHRGARDIEDVLKERYQGDYSMYHTEDVSEAVKAKERSAACLVMYLLFSILRFALFFPITIMVLLEKNICSLYLGLSNAEFSKGLALVPHCSTTDSNVIVLTLLLFFLDAYMVYNVFQLWRWYRTSISIASDGKRYPTWSYGSPNEAIKQIGL